jgi:hypothetical protein
MKVQTWQRAQHSAPNDFNPKGSGRRVDGSGWRDIRRRARQLHTYTRPFGFARNSAFPNSGRCVTACWPTQRCQMGSALAPRARSCIRLLAELWARPARKPEPTAATMGTESLTERRAQEVGRPPEPEQTLPRARRRSLGAYGIAPETVASCGRRSLPPLWRLSIGSRIIS